VDNSKCGLVRALAVVVQLAVRDFVVEASLCELVDVTVGKREAERVRELDSEGLPEAHLVRLHDSVHEALVVEVGLPNAVAVPLAVAVGVEVGVPADAAAAAGRGWSGVALQEPDRLGAIALTPH
jgi:hypothetical protein